MNRKIILFLNIFIAICFCKNRSENLECSGTCYGNICLLDGYSPDDPPKTGDNQTVTVLMQYDIAKVISVDTDLNVGGVQISLTQTWMDNRINFRHGSDVDEGQWVAAPRRMYKEPDNLPKIWVPSIWVFSMTSFEVKRTYEDQSYLAIEKINSTNRGVLTYSMQNR